MTAKSPRIRPANVIASVTSCVIIKHHRSGKNSSIARALPHHQIRIPAACCCRGPKSRLIETARELEGEGTVHGAEENDRHWGGCYAGLYGGVESRHTATTNRFCQHRRANNEDYSCLHWCR